MIVKNWKLSTLAHEPLRREISIGICKGVQDSAIVWLWLVAISLEIHDCGFPLPAFYGFVKGDP